MKKKFEFSTYIGLVTQKKIWSIGLLMSLLLLGSCKSWDCGCPMTETSGQKGKQEVGKENG